MASSDLQKSRPVLSRFAALVAAGLLLASAAAPAAAQSSSADNLYVLGAGDVLNVTIWGEGGLSDRFTIEDDGTFVLPMLGRVRAGGLTVPQLQDALVHQLADGFFKNPKVTVLVADYQSQHVLVLGEVRSPGRYTLKGPTTVLELLGTAGSLTADAGPVALVRRKGVEFTVDLAPIQDGEIASNPRVQNGDTIVVPKATPVHVYGYVGRPGDYAVAGGTTVRQVLALAGGVSQRGSAGRIKVIRVVDGREHETDVDLNDAVQPGDTIVVPERIF
jgi:polysaccharide export outer membrane protein